MPVNPLPILIPIFLVWLAITVLLFRWRRRVGGSFILITIVAIAVLIMNTGVERKYDEDMAFRLHEIGGFSTVELTTSRGEQISDNSKEVVAHLHGRTNRTVRVSMTGLYDFGHLRAYNILSIDGISTSP
jgi:hypothetical protein